MELPGQKRPFPGGQHQLVACPRVCGAGAREAKVLGIVLACCAHRKLRAHHDPGRIAQSNIIARHGAMASGSQSGARRLYGSCTSLVDCGQTGERQRGMRVRARTHACSKRGRVASATCTLRPWATLSRERSSLRRCSCVHTLHHIGYHVRRELQRRDRWAGVCMLCTPVRTGGGGGYFLRGVELRVRTQDPSRSSS
jgi:hypothetical protein